MTQIPYQMLSAELLRSVIEEYVTREGTDYGGPVSTLEEKVSQVLAQLMRGEATVTFDPETERCDIRPIEK